MSDLRAYAWSMSQLPGMPPIAPPTRGRGTCESCGGGTYKGESTCYKCQRSQAALVRRAARRAAQHESAQLRPRISCWICAKPMISHGAERPTCKDCRQKHGSGVCSKCGGPKRLAKPGMCRSCADSQRIPRAYATGPRICLLCEESYVPRPKARPDQRWCSKSCAQAWRNGARPPYERQVVTGMARKVAKARARRLRHAQTWDGITDEEILERDGWRCQIPGCKRRPIRKDLKYPHPRSKSIDHIVPLSHGGDDAAENKRAAHFGCNVARGNEMGDEQVALFGVIREPPLVTRTVNGATTKTRVRPVWLCACGNSKPRQNSPRCEACQKQRNADAEERRRALAEDRRLKAERTATLHAEIRKFRAQGFTTRAIAAHLGTSPRMVVRVGLADPVTGKLPS